MKILKEIIVSILIGTLCLLSGYFGWNLQIGIVGFLSLSYGFMIKPTKKMFSLLIFLVPFVFFYNSLLFFDRNFHTLPIGLMPIPMYFIGLYLRKVFRRNRINFVLLSLFAISFLGMTSFYLMPNYLDYYFNYEKIRTEKAKTKLPILNVYDSEGNIIDFEKYENKILVIDIWSTRCSWCFKYFPHLQKIKKEYAQYDNIAFVSLNSMQRRDSVHAVIEISDSLLDGFHHWFTKYPESKEEMNRLGITKYPNFIVTNSRKEIVYFGNADPGKKNLHRSIRKSLDKLIEGN